MKNLNNQSLKNTFKLPSAGRNKIYKKSANLEKQILTN